MILGGSAAPLRAPPCALCACARQLPGALTTKSGEAGTREIILELFVPRDLPRQYFILITPGFSFANVGSLTHFWQKGDRCQRHWQIGTTRRFLTKTCRNRVR